MKKLVLFTSIAFLALSSCQDHKDSPEIVQALKVQEEFLQLADMVESKIAAEIDIKKASIDSCLAAGDSLTHLRAEQALELLRVQKEAFDHWKSTVVELPGHHHHEPGETCDHDHSKDHLLENMPDAELLQMQLELEERLKEIADKLGVKSEDKDAK
jgi:hypothetical protein